MPSWWILPTRVTVMAIRTFVFIFYFSFPFSLLPPILCLLTTIISFLLSLSLFFSLFFFSIFFLLSQLKHLDHLSQLLWRSSCQLHFLPLESYCVWRRSWGSAADGETGAGSWRQTTSVCGHTPSPPCTVHLWSLLVSSLDLRGCGCPATSEEYFHRRSMAMLTAHPPYPPTHR